MQDRREVAGSRYARPAAVPRPGPTAFAVVGLMCLLFALRTLDSSLTLMFFDAGTGPIAVAIAPFAAALLAWPAALLLSPRGFLAGTAAALAAATLVEVVVRQEWVQLISATVAFVAGAWWLAALGSATSRRTPSPLPAALPLALSIDFVLRVAGHSEPLNELPLAVAAAVTVAGVIVFAVAAPSPLEDAEHWTAPDARGAVALAAVPALLLLAESTALNPQQIAAAAGLGGGPEGAGSYYAGALAVACGLLAGWLLPGGWARSAVATAAALGIGAGLVWAHAGLVALLGGALAAMGVLLSASALLAHSRRTSGSLLLASTALGCGWLVEVVANFLYYGKDSYVPVLAAVAAGVVLVVLAAPRLAPAGPRWDGRLVAALAIAVSGLTLAFSPHPALAPATNSLRLMTYNVHLGYANEVVPDLDAIADTIGREAPDVVALEEVARGAPIAGDHDVATVLAERLRMAYVFRPSDGDLYGVAFLSRVRIDGVRSVRLDRSPGETIQPRQLLVIRVTGVEIGVTHLVGDEAAKEAAMQSVVRAVETSPRVVVAGDFNSEPGSPQIELLRSSGFTDLPLSVGAGGPTAGAASPSVRIDHIWGRGVSATRARVVTSTASDHRPVVVDLALG